MQVHDDVDIQQVMTRIGYAMQALSNDEENMQKILDNVESAHNVGWFLDPTAYRDALYRGDMDNMAELLRSLKEPLRIWKEKIEPKITRI
jgi:hypothetical protein